MYVENGCFEISELQIMNIDCLLLDYIIKTISFQLFEQKMIKFEKLRQSKVNPDVKNEVNIPFD